MRSAANVPAQTSHHRVSLVTDEGSPADFAEGSQSSDVSPVELWPGAITGGVLLFDTVYHNSPIFRACRTGDHALVAQFATLGSLDALLIESPQGHTPLTLAAMHGNEKVCVVLLDAGVGVDHETSRGYTALIEAVRGMHAPLVKLLVERFQALPRRLNRLKVSAISEAERRGFSDIF